MSLTPLPLTIPAGQSLSAPLQVGGLKLVRIAAPDAWDAAPLTFRLSLDGSTWWDLQHVAQSAEGGWTPYEVSVPRVTPGCILLLPVDLGSSLGWIVFRSGTRSKPVNQSADRTFTVIFD
jgi:hypothetical protein